MNTHSEAAFETALGETLLGGGYEMISAESFDCERAIFPEIALDFIRVTQPKHWQKKGVSS